MAVQTWQTGVVGNWFTAANWVSGNVPQTGDTVIIGSGTSIIESGDPSILGEAILLGGSAVGTPVTLEADSATFDDTVIDQKDVNTSLTVVGGEPTSSPLNATFLIGGSTTFDGQIFVEAIGGSLTIDVQSDGSTPGNFTLLNSDGRAVLLVTQESFLTFTGQTVTNGGVIQVEGGAEIDSGVTFTGSGLVELDNGGVLLAEGSVGSGQQIAFADGSGRLLISNTDGFEGVIGFTNVGGGRIDLTDVQAQSAQFIPGERGNPGVLELYAEPNQTGPVVAQLSMQLINAQSLTPLPHDQQTLTTADFTLGSDGTGGTLITYAPQGPTFLEASMPVPVIAETGSMVALDDILVASFGTASPGFYSMTLLPTDPYTNTLTSDGYWADPNVTPAWFVNGTMITEPTVVEDGDNVELLVGNQIIGPAQIQAQVTADATGTDAGFVTYSVWTVDPAVTQAVQGTPGSPTPADVVASANAFATAFPGIVNNNLCNWIADNVAAGAGASMPLPDASLDPSLNVSGGFWRIVYTGTGPAPVQDWSTLVEPGDIVRLEWFKPELPTEHISGHSTTVLAAVNAEGLIEVYDNIDFVDHVSTIGVHTASYWQQTNPSGITIYRLDPNQQYLIEGTSLSEVIQGSVFDDLIEPGGGADIINAGPGDNEIQDTTAHLNGITVTDFDEGDTFDFTDLNPDRTVVTYKDGALHVLNDFVQVAEITLPKPPPGTSFVVTPDGSGGTTIGLAPSKGHVLQDVLGKLEYKISQSLPPPAAEVLKDVVEKLADKFADVPRGRPFRDSASALEQDKVHPGAPGEHHPGGWHKMMDIPTNAAGRVMAAASDGIDSSVMTDSSAPNPWAFLAHHSHDWL